MRTVSARFAYIHRWLRAQYCEVSVALNHDESMPMNRRCMLNDNMCMLNDNMKEGITFPSIVLLILIENF
jgi:hypothetical protein